MFPPMAHLMIILIIFFIYAPFEWLSADQSSRTFMPKAFATALRSLADVNVPLITYAAFLRLHWSLMYFFSSSTVMRSASAMSLRVSGLFLWPCRTCDVHERPFPIVLARAVTLILNRFFLSSLMNISLPKIDNKQYVDACQAKKSEL